MDSDTRNEGTATGNVEKRGRVKTDYELLREYATDQSEAAFAELVSRYAGLVHSAAFRQLHSDTLAEEATQAVFILLARKAASMTSEIVLSGWLHRATRFAANDLAKAERRRLMRETLAHQMNAIENDGMTRQDPSEEWKEISRELDACIARLAEPERHALLLRYFENRPLAEVGAALGTTAEAARKRVTRALEKLQALLAENGVQSPADRLATLMSAHAAPLAPASLTAKTLGAVLAAGKGSAVGGASAVADTIARGYLWLKIKPWLAGLGAVAITAGSGAAFYAAHSTGRSARLAPAADAGDYRPAGFDDPRVVHAFVQRVKNLVERGESEQLASLVRFPLRINSTRGVRLIESREQFLQNYPELFNPEVIALVLKSPSQRLLCTTNGVMIGAGQVWIAPAQRAHHPAQPEIIALNL